MYGLMNKNIRIKDQQLIFKMDKISEIDLRHKLRQINKVLNHKKKGNKFPYILTTLGNYEKTLATIGPASSSVKTGVVS